MADIRAANPSDAGNIARVYVETWRNTYAGVLPDHVLVGMSHARQRRAWETAIHGHRETVLLAEEEGHVVGLGSCGPARKAGLGFAGEVYTLYVLPDYQNQGIGRRLVTRLFASLGEKHGNSALIWVLAANPSRFFYEVMGGKRVGERDEKLWGVVLHEIAYGWPDLTAVIGVR